MTNPHMNPHPAIEEQVKYSGYVLTPPQWIKKANEEDHINQDKEISVLTQERDNLLLRLDELEAEVSLLEDQLAEAKSQIPVKRPPGRPKKKQEETDG